MWNAPFFTDAFADAYIPKHFGTAKPVSGFGNLMASGMEVVKAMEKLFPPGKGPIGRVVRNTHNLLLAAFNSGQLAQPQVAANPQVAAAPVRWTRSPV